MAWMCVFSSSAFNPRMIWPEEWERMEEQLLFELVGDEIWQLLPGWIHRLASHTPQMWDVVLGG